MGAPVGPDEGQEVYDLAIIGAGPAGLTAALYAARAGLSRPRYSSASPPAASCAQTEHLENYPGYTRSTSGFELSMDMYASGPLASGRRPSWRGRRLRGLLRRAQQARSRPFNDLLRAARVIVATGAVASASSGCPARMSCAAAAYPIAPPATATSIRDKDVVVVGGGNTAAADVIYLVAHLPARCTWCTGATSCGPRPSTMNAWTRARRTSSSCWDSRCRGVHHGRRTGASTGLKLRNVKTDDERVLAAYGRVHRHRHRGPTPLFLEGDAGNRWRRLYRRRRHGQNRRCPACSPPATCAPKELRQVVTAVADGANCRPVRLRVSGGQGGH